MKMTISRFNLFLVTLFASVMILSSCNTDLTNIGVAIQPPEDDIEVFSDTFHLEAENWMVDAISAQADTMVFGCYYSPVYGMTKADLLLQLAAPDNYIFPDASYNPTPDSLALLFYYTDYDGSSYSPLQFAVYEMNKNDINYTDRYFSNLNPADYCDTSILMGKRVFTTIDLSRRSSTKEDSASTPYVRYKFNDTQVNRFFNMLRSNSNLTTSLFLQKFKGIYVTSTYGSSTLAYFNQATMYLYYHYTYKRDGHDTIVKTSIAFPANHEVRQLNRFTHSDRSAVVASIPDSLLYIESAAGIYPKVRIPYGRIFQRMKQRFGQDTVFSISAAEMVVECMEDDEKDKYTPMPTAIMAIKTSSFDDFLKRNTIVNGYERDRVVAYYSSGDDNYTFDLSYLLSMNLRDAFQNGGPKPDSMMEFVLVPLNVEYTSTSSGNTTITSMRPLVKMAATRVRSPKNKFSPMRLKILYEKY